MAGLDEEGREVDLVADVAAGAAALHGEEVFSVGVVGHGDGLDDEDDKGWMKGDGFVLLFSNHSGEMNIV